MNDRYSRQILFKPIGENGQRKLKKSHVLIAGAGALGSASAEMLVRAGIGHLTIVDRDYVEWSNLQRQQLYTEADARAGTPKALAAARQLSMVNSEVTIQPIVSDFMDFASKSRTEDYHLIIDATDNFETRLYINDLAQKNKIPWIYGGGTGSTGMTFTIVPGETPCLSCMLKTFPSVNDTCDTVGIIAPAIQWVTAHQITEAMKLLTDNAHHLRRTLLITDIWTNQQTSIKIDAARKSYCRSCGTRPTYPYLLENRNQRATVLCGRDTIQIRPIAGQSLNKEEIKDKLTEASQTITVNEFLIHAHLDERRRIVVFHDGRVLLHGMTNVTEAQAVYDRYIRS